MTDEDNTCSLCGQPQGVTFFAVIGALTILAAMLGAGVGVVT